VQHSLLTGGSAATRTARADTGSIMNVVLRGAPAQDLTPLLGHLIWPHQAASSTMLVTNTTHYLWYLPCHKHLRILTVQGARKQAADAFGQLSACERCAIPYRSVGPEPQPNDVHRSYCEQVAWLQLECVLESVPVTQHMSAISLQHGKDLVFAPAIGPAGHVAPNCQEW
jgi:hypothetical protein